MNRLIYRGLPAAFAGLLLVWACDDSTAPADRIVEGVDFAELFAAPSSAEIGTLLSEWSSRDVTARSVDTVATSATTIAGAPATVRVLSHVVDGTAKHYGAVMVPDGAAPGSLPVLIYAHGGDGGVDIDDLIPLLPIVLGLDASAYVLLAPSFRAEPLVLEGTTYLSEGEPSPWDRDVDDALALLNAVLASTPEADPDRIGVLGFSRGGAVGLLMTARDPRIDLIVEFFGPTDFFGPFVQDVVEEALRGSPRDLPGLEYLNAEFIQPLKRGEVTIADMRLELLRRSPVYFADRFPQLQIHHGTADEVVPVGEAERLIEVMVALGRGEPDFEHYLYAGGTHNPLTLSESIPRTQSFIGRLLAPSPVLYAVSGRR